MKKFINWFVSSSLVASLLFSSIVATIFSLLQLAYIIFNINPYYKVNLSNTGYFGFGSNYENGIEVPIFASTRSFPDTSIEYKTEGGSSGGYSNGSRYKKTELQQNDSIIYMDTVVGIYDLSYWNSNKVEKVTDFTIEHFKVRIKPTSSKQRFSLVFPKVLFGLIFAFFFLQFARFLHAIYSGNVFNNRNFKRLQNIGLSLILAQFLSFIFSLFFNQFNVTIRYESTIKNWRSPLYISGSIENDFDFTYFIVGIIFLILSKAFKNGYLLKNEQDLTV